MEEVWPMTPPSTEMDRTVYSAMYPLKKFWTIKTLNEVIWTSASDHFAPVEAAQVGGLPSNSRFNSFKSKGHNSGLSGSVWKVSLTCVCSLVSLQMRTLCVNFGAACKEITQIMRPRRHLTNKVTWSNKSRQKHSSDWAKNWLNGLSHRRTVHMTV